MQRSRLPPCAFSLLAYRFPIPFQHFPHWFPILGRRFHDYFFGLLLEQPGRQRSQLFGVTAKLPPLKLVFVIASCSRCSRTPGGEWTGVRRDTHFVSDGWL